MNIEEKDTYAAIKRSQGRLFHFHTCENDRGAPGSGKGTQGEHLQEDLRLPYYATGEILRAEVKEGSEPLIQLEVALLKATQPQADASLQALMFRIEQLESRLSGSPAGSQGEGEEHPRAASVPAQATGPGRSEAPVASAARGAGPAAATAPAVAEEPEHDPEPFSSALTFERICELWPALCEAVRESNEMVAAVLLEARPSSLEGEKLTVAFADGAAFMRKKAEANGELLRGAVRGLTGQSLALGFELGRPVAAPAVLSEEELIERLKANLAAEEVFDDDDDEEHT